MASMPGCRMRGFAIGPVRPYGDVGAVEVICAPHPYLLCSPCGVRLYQGQATTGATVLICHSCQRIVDVRRIG
jgi:hypothetical protein